MQFSKMFLFLSLAFLVLTAVLWNVGRQNHWFSDAEQDSGEAQTEEGASKSSKMNEAFGSLEKMGGKETPILVEASPAERGVLVQRVSSQGRVHSYEQAEVINEVAGKLVKLLVRDGDRVEQGQVLAHVDDREYKVAFADAKAQYLAGQADLVEYNLSFAGEGGEEKRAEALKDLETQYKAKKIGDDEYRRQKFLLEMEHLRSGNLREEVLSAKHLATAEGALERARINLEKCLVRAPFSGTIFGVEVSQGSYLNGSTKIAQIVNMRELVVKAKVLESEIGQVYQGRPARIHFTALPDLGFVEGKVRAISPFVNEEDKTVETIIEISGQDPRIRPGMFAEVDIDSQIYEDKLLVPKEAVLLRDDRKLIFKVSDDMRAKWVYVTTGVENDELVEIVSGKLEPGNMVLTSNHFTMGHDTLVKISKP